MKPIKGRDFAGAPGGYWKVLREASTSRAIRQLTNNACGPACGEMLFQSRGVWCITQANIAAAKKCVRSTPETLAQAMNDLQERLNIKQGGKWLGWWVDIIRTPRKTFNDLSKNGPFITSLKSFGTDSHMVVADGLDKNGQVIIRDPYEGTEYFMEWADFEGVWQGMSVWWSREHL